MTACTVLFYGQWLAGHQRPHGKQIERIVTAIRPQHGGQAMDRTEAVAALLAETEQAHGVYEASVLGGVYDQAWPAWYAAYAVDHGIGELLGHPVTADNLAAFLRRTFEALKNVEPKPTEPWSAWTARRIAAEL